MSKKQQLKKDRFIEIIAEHKVPSKIARITFSNDTFRLYDEDNKELEIINLTSGIKYKTENGKNRTLNRIESNSNIMSINLIEQICQFDMIFAVDTNTKNINGVNISVPSTQCCEINKDENETSFKFCCFGLLCLKDIEENHPEKIGIKLLIQAIMSNQKYSKNLKIGVVTDHDLGNINKYNKKEIPLCEDFYLPENFTLIYATDKPKENILNILISKCDKEANKFFTKVIAGKIIPQSYKKTLSN